jgi:hypothetical protein
MAVGASGTYRDLPSWAAIGPTCDFPSDAGPDAGTGKRSAICRRSEEVP